MKTKNFYITLSLVIIIVLIYFISRPSALTDPDSTIKGSHSTRMSVISLRENATTSPIILIEYPQFQNMPSLNQLITKEVQTRLSEFRQAVEENKTARLATGGSAAELGSDAYTFITSWQTSQINEQYISFIMRFDQYSGGANANSTLMTVNYDVTNNKFLSITDIVTTKDALDRLSKIAREQLSATLNETSVGNIAVDMLNDGTEPKLENFNNFTFDDNSITIYFPKYAVAPGAYGEQKVVISRRSLK